MRIAIFCVAILVALAAASSAQAQWVTVYRPMYAAPAPMVAYYPPAPVTTYYAPAPVPMTTYYAPGPVPMTAYYGPAAPVYVGRPAVVRTKVYYPGQPLRNVWRAITP